MMHGLTYPTGVCGVKTDPGFAEILRKEIDRWGKEPMGDANWNMLQGSETYYPSAARLGFNPDTILFRLKKSISKTKFSNYFIPHGGGGIEMLSPVTSCINEMLLQGYEGIIRVFPTWPANKNAKFENLRTHGAFLVSSEKSNGKIKYIKVTSEKGRLCTLENPWGNSEVTMKRNNKRVETLSGDILHFKTEQNEHLLITPRN